MAARNPALPRSAAGDRNPWIIAIVVSMATFMEVLDTTIANVSLKHIAGSLAASQDESTWILTSYLISNAVVLPISGWLAELIGRKRFYMLCVATFTASSFLCALAPNLTMMIIFRVLQGMGGGGLAPTEQSIFADSFPPEKRQLAFAVYGITIIVAPAVGPVLGGWLTDNYSWHWIFLINLPVGLLSLALIYLLIDEPQAVREDTRKFRANFIFDWLGCILIAATFGCLQVVLDRFQEDDGFASLRIVLFATVSAFCFVAMVMWEWNHPQPVLNIKLFKIPSFAISCALMFMVGFYIYSTTNLIPQLAQSLLGYDAYAAGKVLTLGGLAAALIMPIAGTIGRKVSPKAVLMAAFLVSGAAFVHMSHLNLEVSGRELAWARVYQMIAMPFLFVTLTAVGYVGIPPDKSAQASSIINLMRNLGGSVGVAVASTAVIWRTQFHHVRLSEHVSAFSTLPHPLSGTGLPAAQALVQSNAQIMSYLDVYWLFAIIAFCVAPFALLLKSPRPGAAGAH
ncbi:MAG TPA: DHA2 family efflux MFS transporter permease subunit [Steroidobacteraceae bacterium]|jgi:DHA2 family multidrug resistance protein|nr:DHA2 family efflux MFS transporter permease subunit [Steroidobacteraceae bacterium]